MARPKIYIVIEKIRLKFILRSKYLAQMSAHSILSLTRLQLSGKALVD